MSNNIEKPIILIVDDVPKNLQVLGTILYQQGCEIAMADSGASALETLQEITPAMILLDVMMPEMDGYEVCEIIKSQESTKDIPVIFLTAKTETEDIVKGFRMGAVDYLTKPFNSEELIARVRTQLELHDKTQQLKELNATLEEKVLVRTQELNSANQKLLQLDKSKNYFLSLLAHELNTPLTGIDGFVNLLKAEISDSEHLEYLDNIKQSVSRLHRFSSFSQLITRIQNNSYHFHIEDIPIKLLIETAVMSLENKLAAKSINLRKELTKEEFSIKGDSYLIQKVIEIILDNSIKYSHENGIIEIRLTKNADEVRLDIIDKGIGFSKEALSNLFTFFESDDLMSHGEGFGLGMATAKIILDSHNAAIKAQNNIDTGATISILFYIL
jgi:two-component system sensor histidine kinase/response regulator